MIEEATGKPESYIMVSIHSPSTMMFAGDEMPTAFVEYKAIGLDSRSTHKLSTAICSAIEQEMRIPSRRIYIQFDSVGADMWGWDKHTFQSMQHGKAPRL
jgi:phenylpyruvate tautomerase PptA (4-oxalocrotonate tautomerase family)